MKKIYILSVLCVVSISAFISKRRNGDVSLEDKLTVVFVHPSCEKNDKECKEHLNKLKNSFDSFVKDHSYRKIGIVMMHVDINHNTLFADKYVDNYQGDKPMVLFFNRGKLLKDYTLFPVSGKELAKKVDETLHDCDTEVGKIVMNLQNDYDDKKAKDEDLARMSAASMLYPTPYDVCINGYRTPYSRYNTYIGFGLGLGRNCW